MAKVKREYSWLGDLDDERWPVENRYEYNDRHVHYSVCPVRPGALDPGTCICEALNIGWEAGWAARGEDKPESLSELSIRTMAARGEDTR